MWKCSLCRKISTEAISFRCFECKQTDVVCIEDKPLFLMHANNNVFKCKFCEKYTFPFDFSELSAIENRTNNQQRNPEFRNIQIANYGFNQAGPSFSSSAIQTKAPVIDQGFSNMANNRFDARNVFSQNVQSASMNNNPFYISNTNLNEGQLALHNNCQLNSLQSEKGFTQNHNPEQNSHFAARQNIFTFNQFLGYERRNDGTSLFDSSSFSQGNNNINDRFRGSFQRQDEVIAVESDCEDVDMYADMEEELDPRMFLEYDNEVKPEDLTVFDNEVRQEDWVVNGNEGMHEELGEYEKNRVENQRVEEQVDRFRESRSKSNSIFDQVERSKQKKFS